MGKHLSNVEFGENQPGCMWGIFHVLDYHHWHHVKKMFPHNWHIGFGKHTRGNGIQRSLNVNDSSEAREFSEDEMDLLLVNPSTARSRPTKKKPRRARNKSFTKDQHRHWVPFFHGRNYITNMGKEKAASTQSDTCMNAFELFQINKDTFLKELGNPDSDIFNHFKGLKVSNSQIRLKKSSSFPVAEFSHGMSISPTKPKHKQNEIWPFPKLVTSKPTEEQSTKSIPSVAYDEDAKFSSVGPLHQRTSSLNESMDRYTQLFESSYGRERKWKLSKSLKLSNERWGPSSRGSKSYGRMFSLPEFLSDSSYLYESSRDGYGVSSDAIVETECLENIAEENEEGSIIESEISVTMGINDEEDNIIGRVCEDLKDQAVGENSLNREVQMGFTEDFSSEVDQVSPVSVLTKPTKFQMSEGAYCDVNNGIIEPTNKNINNILHIQSDKKTNPEFNFVRDVLELSGFIGNKYVGSWYSVEQPLNPSVLDESKVNESYDKELLFDLVNVALIEIYDRSFTYYPRALSFSCRVRPMPMGNHLLEEVWTSVSGYMRFSTKVEKTLDRIVSRDFAKDDGWMNLQLESECLGLDIEDLILEELLEEIICS